MVHPTLVRGSIRKAYVLAVFVSFFVASSPHGIVQETSTRKVEYRDFATANLGESSRGKLVFEDANKAACIKCHSIDSSRRGVGPDLATIANKFERPGLIQAILDPSSSIAIGYGITIVVTDAGLTHQGVLQRVTDDFVELKDKDSKTIRIETRAIEEQRESSTSLMPERIETLISPQEFADLVAYLQTLRQAPSSQPSQRGAVDEIDRCKTPLELVPRFDDVTFVRPVALEPIPNQKQQFLAVEHGGAIFVIDASGARVQSRGLLDLTRTIRLGGAWFVGRGLSSAIRQQPSCILEVPDR